MNFSAFFIFCASKAVERAQAGDYYADLGIYEAIVFAHLAVEALLNEQAFIEVQQLGRHSERVYRATDRGAQGFDRVQAILELLYGRCL